MAISVKHNFVSAKADGTDESLLRPSNWNEDHNIELASGTFIGRTSTGVGAAEELAISSDAATMLSKADIAAIVAFLGISPPTTGDAKLTFKSSPDTGWVFMNDGTIGNAASGASTLAHADTEALFTLLYSAPFTDGVTPIQTSAGAATTRSAQGTAATAFAAGCRLILPKQLGRTIIAANPGAASGLSQRLLGGVAGEENHVTTINEMPSHFHSAGISDPGHAHNYTRRTGPIHQDGTNSGTVVTQDITDTTTTNATGVRVASANGLDTTYSQGGGAAHNNMMPYTVWNIMVKL